MKILAVLFVMFCAVLVCAWAVVTEEHRSDRFESESEHLGVGA